MKPTNGKRYYNYYVQSGLMCCYTCIHTGFSLVDICDICDSVNPIGICDKYDGGD
jgi:hypothetical protein